MENKIKECSYCQAKINTEIDSYFTCQDNFIQTKYFDTEDENVFCCQECFCNYIQLEEIDPEDDDKEFIRIDISDDIMYFPYFEKGSMYKGMKLTKGYTLEELGL